MRAATSVDAFSGSGSYLMIVDTHVHIWQVPPVAPVGPTAPSFTSRPSEAATAEELLSDMDAHGVDWAVIVQSSFSTWDNGYIADSAASHPRRLIAHGLVDPEDPQNADQARRWMAERGVRGFRFHPVYYDDAVMTRQANARLWETLEELGAVVQVHMRAIHAPQLDEIAARHPNIPFLIDHMGYPDFAESPHFSSFRPILNLAKHSNVHVKISDTARHSKAEFPYPDVQAAIRLLKNAFGIERMLWGTGYPGRHRLAYGWPSLADELRFVREGLDWLSATEQQRLLGGNAAMVWKLD